MRTYTLTECCTLLRTNPKTLHKWLEQEGMQPQRLRADTRIRYLTQEQMEHLAEVYDRPHSPDEEQTTKERSPSSPYPLLAERLDQHERRLDHLEREVGQAQASLASLQKQIAEHTCEPTTSDPQIARSEGTERQAARNQRRPTSEARTKTRPQKARGKGLPRTLVLLRAFSEQHHVPLKAADRASKAGKIAVVRGRWLVNSRYATEALGARGQQDFYEVFHEREGFTRCERCPHQQAVSSLDNV